MAPVEMIFHAFSLLSHTHTHLVEERDRGLQDLLPLAELSLVKLPLKLQDLSPLSCCLRQRTEERKARGEKETQGEKISPRT